MSNQDIAVAQRPAWRQKLYQWFSISIDREVVVATSRAIPILLIVVLVVEIAAGLSARRIVIEKPHVWSWAVSFIEESLFCLYFYLVYRWKGNLIPYIFLGRLTYHVAEAVLIQFAADEFIFRTFAVSLSFRVILAAHIAGSSILLFSFVSNKLHGVVEGKRVPIALGVSLCYNLIPHFLYNWVYAKYIDIRPLNPFPIVVASLGVVSVALYGAIFWHNRKMTADE